MEICCLMQGAQKSGAPQQPRGVGWGGGGGQVIEGFKREEAYLYL